MPQELSLEGMAAEVRQKIFEEFFSSEEIRFGPGGSLDAAAILEVSSLVREDATEAVNASCTIGYTMGHKLPYLPQYLRADRMRHVAVYTDPVRWGCYPPPLAMFPCLQTFKAVLEWVYDITLPERISRLAHQMAFMDGRKKQLFCYLLCMLDNPRVRHNFDGNPSTHNPLWVSRVATVYQVHFQATMSHHDYPEHDPNDDVFGVSVSRSKASHSTNPNVGYDLRRLQESLAVEYVGCRNRPRGRRIQASRSRPPRRSSLLGHPWPRPPDAA